MGQTMIDNNHTSIPTTIYGSGVRGPLSWICHLLRTFLATLAFCMCLGNVGSEFWKLQTNFGGELNGIQ